MNPSRASSVTLVAALALAGCNGGGAAAGSAKPASTTSAPTTSGTGTTLAPSSGTGSSAGPGSGTSTGTSAGSGTSVTGTTTADLPSWGAGPLTTPGATYYAAPTGADTNPGTQASPFRQIRAAVAVMQPGDTVLVADGSYLGFDVTSLNGAAGQPITIQAQAKAALVTATTDRSDNRDNIFISLSSYIIVDGVISSNAPRSGCRIDQSPNVTVRNGQFGTNATWGIFTDFSDDTLLENNECFASGTQHGIYVSNSSQRPVVRKNQLHDNAGCGLHMNGDLSQGGTGLIGNALVEDNVIWNNGVQGGSGINCDGVQSSVIRNNLLYGNHASGISLFQIDAAEGPKDDQVFHNTIDQAADGRAALNISNTTGLITVRNNIFFDEDSGKYAVDYHAASDVTNVDSDYNALGGAANFSNDDGTTLFSLAQWQAQSGQEAHSITATLDSLFVNAPGADYHLASGSPAVDAGQTLASVTIDLDGNPRPHGAASDMGCYEQ